MTEVAQFYGAATKFFREYVEAENENFTKFIAPDIISWNRKVARTYSNIIKLRFRKKWLTTFNVYALN